MKVLFLPITASNCGKFNPPFLLLNDIQSRFHNFLVTFTDQNSLVQCVKMTLEDPFLELWSWFCDYKGYL